MAQQTQMGGELFKKGDIVKLHGLKSKKKWNNKRANVIGDFDPKSKRYPIELIDNKNKNKTSNNNLKNQALIKATNMKIDKYGIGWKIDGKSQLQVLNMLLKSYTRDFEAFAKLTARNKTIFDDNFEYKMHENIVCNSLSEFDSKLTVMKNNIIKLSETTNENVPKLLNDKVSVLALNDDLTHFEITVEIDLHDNNKFWRRVSEVKLNQKEGLIQSAQVLRIEIIDKSEKKNDETEQKTQTQTDGVTGNDSNNQNASNNGTEGPNNDSNASTSAKTDEKENES